jgi:hypothetical protein
MQQIDDRVNGHVLWNFEIELKILIHGYMPKKLFRCCNEYTSLFTQASQCIFYMISVNYPCEKERNLLQ